MNYALQVIPNISFSYRRDKGKYRPYGSYLYVKVIKINIFDREEGMRIKDILFWNLTRVKS